MNEQTRWARNKGGSVVHRSGCRHGRIPWVWADCLPDGEIVDMVEHATWLRFGACCAPALSRCESMAAHPAGKGNQ